MQSIHKNIINKWLKLYFYNYDSSYFSEKQYENFAKNIPLYFKASNEFIQMKFVQQNPNNIIYIIDFEKGIYPSEKVQIMAVQLNIDTIEYLVDFEKGIYPSERTQFISVSKQGSVIQYIKNPSEKIQIIAVKQNIYNIRFIKKPTQNVIDLYNKILKSYKKDIIQYN
jgi:hypothetical protein